MNERQAIQAGYVFTGAYSSHDKEEMKTRAKAERAKGNKACVVDVPTSKYSRGGRGMGYSVYFIESETNKVLRKIHQIKTKLERARYLVKQLEDELTNLEDELTNLQD